MCLLCLLPEDEAELIISDTCTEKPLKRSVKVFETLMQQQVSL